MQVSRDITNMARYMKFRNIQMMIFNIIFSIDWVHIVELIINY